MENAASIVQRGGEEKQTELDRSLLRGIAWTGGVRWATQIVAWASTLLVARILRPADYGVFTMATVYLGAITLASDFGVGAGVVALRDLTDEQLAQLNGLAVLVGAAAFGGSYLIARPAGRFFSQPQLPAVLIVMSLSFIISSFQSVPRSLLCRELRFKLLSVINGGRAIMTSGLVLALAIAGFRYWALVAGSVAAAAVGTILVLTQRRHRFAWPRWRNLGREILFSSHISIVNLGWYWYSNADFVIAGRMFGQAALGAYSLAWELANAPIQKVTSVIGSVTPAYFSAVQNDRGALKRYLLRPTEAISFLLFPVMIGITLVAPEAVPLVLGVKWDQAVLPLQLLAVYATVVSVMPLMSQVLVVVGETKFLMWNTIASAVLIPAAFVVGSRWGPSGIAAAWVVAYPINAVPIYLRTARRLEMGFRQYTQVLRPAVGGSIAMVAVVLFVKWLMPSTTPPLVRLLAEVATGAAMYIGFQLLFYRDRVFSFYRSARMLRAGAAEENAKPPERDRFWAVGPRALRIMKIFPIFYGSARGGGRRQAPSAFLPLSAVQRCWADRSWGRQRMVEQVKHVLKRDPVYGEVTDSLHLDEIRQREHSLIYAFSFNAGPDLGRILVKMFRAGPVTAECQFDSLRTLWPRFANSRSAFLIPRPLGFLPELGAIIMEEIPGLNLAEFVHVAKLLVPKGRRWSEVLSAFRNSGQWLRRFHDCDSGAEDQYLNVGKIMQDVTSQVEKCVAMGIAPRFGAQILDRLRRGLNQLSGDPLRMTLVHGDFKLDNIVVNGTCVAGVDISIMGHNVVYGDLSSFCNSVELLRVHPVSLLVSSKRIATLKAEFLSGYFGDEAYPAAAVNLFQVIGLTSKYLYLCGKHPSIAARRLYLVPFFAGLIRTLLERTPC